MRISDWSSDVCSSQFAKLYARKSKLAVISAGAAGHLAPVPDACRVAVTGNFRQLQARNQALGFIQAFVIRNSLQSRIFAGIFLHQLLATLILVDGTQFRHDLSSLPFSIRKHTAHAACFSASARSEEHTSELQSLMRISYAVFCLK